jgi:hypothetical protein
MSFLDLPVDILKEFMHKYLHPSEALKCLRVCKLLNRISDRDIIIKRCIYYNTYVKMMEELDKMIFCPECGIKLANKKGLNIHLRKHKLGKKMIDCGNTLHIYDCSRCGFPDSNFSSHKCCYLVTCMYNHISFLFPWVETLCKDFYILDPKLKLHLCNARCKLCKEVFNADSKYGFGDHYKICPLKSEMIRIYKIQGERTDEEYNSLMLEWDSDPNINNDELAFEQEYLEWKKINLPKV